MKQYFYEGKYWDEEKINNFIQRFSKTPNARMLKTIRMTEGSTILDIGCGIGIVASHIAEKVRSHGNVIGIDMLKTNIDIAKEHFNNPNLEFKVGSADSLKFKPSSFDCVLFLEVLEHVENPAAVLQNIYTLLKPRGNLILSTPNGASYDTFFQNLKSSKKVINNIDKERHGNGTESDHIYMWSLPQLYRLLNRCGFKYVKHEFAGAGFPLTNLDRVFGTNLSDLFSPLYGRFGTSLIIKVRKP